MRTPWVTGPQALRARMVQPMQVQATDPEAGMPPYMESFLAHLRLLVGVPFEYLIPDPRLLPDESIRFFYLDRSWTDRLVDGAIAVGKIGSREQAHHQAHAPAVNQQLDQTERIVRDLQRGGAFARLKPSAPSTSAGVITGFLLRSAAVSGWPQMDVRAYSTDIPESPVPLDPADPNVAAKQLRTLRLERLSPAVLLALFDGIPQLVYLEEPHHGVQFGVREELGKLVLFLRDTTGHLIQPTTPYIPAPVRKSHSHVIAVAELRTQLIKQQKTYSSMPGQTGSAEFALEMLQPPWRQRFEGLVDHAPQAGGSGKFEASISIGARVAQADTQSAVTAALKGKG